MSDALQSKVVLDILQPAGLKGADQDLPLSIRVKHGTNQNGKMIHYYLNYSSNVQILKYPYAAGTDLLTRTAVSDSQHLTVKPWDLLVIEEK